MKRLRLLSVSLMGLSLVGLVSVVNSTKVVLAEEKVVTHEHVDEPTQVLMNEIAKRVNNILDGILAEVLSMLRRRQVPLWIRVTR